MSNIKWKQSDYDELKKSVNAFNAKIRRLEKKEEMEDVILPDKLKYSELKKSIRTRKELEREIRSMNAFRKKGSEKIYENPNHVKLTSWEVKDNRQRNRWINRHLEKEREKIGNLEVTSRGEPTHNTRKETGGIRMNELRPRVEMSNYVRSKTEWKLHRKVTLNKSKTESYKEMSLKKWRDNYVKSLIDNGFSNSIIKLVEKKSLKDFERIMYSEQEAEVSFQYPNGVEHAFKTDILLKIWE